MKVSYISAVDQVVGNSFRWVLRLEASRETHLLSNIYGTGHTVTFGIDYIVFCEVL